MALGLAAEMIDAPEDAVDLRFNIPANQTRQRLNNMGANIWLPIVTYERHKIVPSFGWAPVG